MNVASIPYKWIVAIAFVTGLFMDLMDATIVNVALPQLAHTFHANDTALEWVVNGYLLSLAIWIPASGWIGDRFGTKKTFLFALAMFTLGSALCGYAWSIESLIFFRVLQGIGGGMMTPVGTAMLFRAFPPYERAKASSVTALPVALAPALGPVLGGLIVDTIGWQWIFRVNIPVGIIAFLFGLFFLKEHKEEQAGSFDFLGFFLSGTGLVLLLYSLSVGPTLGWTTPSVLLSGIVGVSFLMLLIGFEKRMRTPILHIKLFRDRLFRTANTVYFFTFAVQLGVLFILPLYLQQFRGLSALESGLTTFAQPIGWVTMSFFVTSLFVKLGPRKIITLGLAGSLLTTILFMYTDIHTNLWFIRGIMFFRGISMASAVVPIQAVVFSNITSEETGRASSIFSTNRQVAASCGVAILGTVLFQTMTMQRSDQLYAYHVAFFAASLIGILSIVFALTIHDSDAAAALHKVSEK